MRILNFKCVTLRKTMRLYTKKIIRITETMLFLSDDFVVCR